MAHSLSAKKRNRQNIKRRLRNRARRSALKKRSRRCLDAITQAPGTDADKAFRELCSTLDREATRGLIHRNAAARQKSRIAKRLNAARRTASA